MARDDPEIRFRCPSDLKARVEAAARSSGRSTNSEIVQRLERSFRAPLMEPKEAARLGLFLGRLEDALRSFRQDIADEEKAGVSAMGSNAAQRLYVLAEEYTRRTRPLLMGHLMPEDGEADSGDDELLPPPPPMPAPSPQLVIPQSLRDFAAVVAETVFRKLEEGGRPGETPAERLERLIQITQEEPAGETARKPSVAKKQSKPRPKKTPAKRA